MPTVFEIAKHVFDAIASWATVYKHGSETYRGKTRAVRQRSRVIIVIAAKTQTAFVKQLRGKLENIKSLVKHLKATKQPRLCKGK